MGGARGKSQPGGRGRRVAALLAAFSLLWATTLLPFLHQLHHRDDHVHTAAGLVHLGSPADDGDEDDDDHAHDAAPADHHAAHAAHDHRGEHAHHRPSHDPRHGDGALEHGFAVITEVFAIAVPELPLALQLEIEPEPVPVAPRFEPARDIACRGPPRLGASI